MSRCVHSDECPGLHAPTGDPVTAETCREFVRKCRLVIEGWGGHPHAEDELTDELLTMFAGGTNQPAGDRVTGG